MTSTPTQTNQRKGRRKKMQAQHLVDEDIEPCQPWKPT